MSDAKLKGPKVDPINTIVWKWQKIIICESVYGELKLP